MQTNDVVSDRQLFVPTSDRGRSIHEFPLSVRLSNVFDPAGIRLLGDLNGRRLSEFARVRNCGSKTLNEISTLVRTLQLATSRPEASVSEPSDSNILQISAAAKDVFIKEIPVSVRLAGVLGIRGVEKLGDLRGVNIVDLLETKNCGRKCILELRELLKRADAGEFTAPPTNNFSEAVCIIIRSIDAGINKLDLRDRKIVEERFLGDRGEPRTLEDVGQKWGLTRERVRQIVKSVCDKVRRTGGPLLARAIEALARDLQTRVIPLTAPFLQHEISGIPTDHTPPFYLCVLSYIAPTVAAWAPGIAHDETRDSVLEPLQREVEKWLRLTGEHPTAQAAFQHISAQPGLSWVSAAEFLRSLRRFKSIIVDFPEPDQPRLRLRRLRLYDVVLPVLGESSKPLTPEEIVEDGRSRFGADAVMLSVRSAENALAAHPDVFRLGPRSFGLLKHFESAESERPRLRDQFAALLKKEKRSISTIEVCDKASIPIPVGVSSYELAEILRADSRFIDLGRRLFGLAAWGIEERQHIKDLLPKILSQADRPLTLSEIHEQLTKFRSASPNGLANMMSRHPKIVRLGFQHYGLRSWGDSRNAFFVAKRSIVERAIRRTDPPIKFGELCDVFKIPVEGMAADMLWKSCAGSERLRRAPDSRGANTLLMHKAVTLEQALASIARTIGRPMPAYELEWELRERFDGLFPNVRLQQIEERLSRGHQFLRNASGAFFLDADFDVSDFDVSAIRATAAKVMREEHEILGCDELLDRLESEGFDLQEMTRGMLASILRGSEELEEVGRERFRAK